MAATSPLMNTYARLPVAFSHGDGAWLFDTEGKRYLDCLSGIAVNTLGHNHPKLVAALREQVARIIHSSNLFEVPLQTELGAKLVELSGMTNVFFCNSGLEANEAAIKIARKFGHGKGIALPEIVVFEKAFHGRSLATLSATGNEKVQKGFEPLVEGFVRIPLNDVAALRKVAAERPNVVAVFMEAIQGEGGIQPAGVEFMREARRLCDEKGWLLMIDEVQCGTGRTGKWFAHQWAGIKADVMPLAKGLASGVPIGAVVAHGAAAEVFGPGNHGTTFGGNPLAMRAGLVTIATMEEDGLLQNAAEVGGWLIDTFRRELGGLSGVAEVRGQGLMIGIELDRSCGELVKSALAAGLVLNVTADRVIRLLPPLIFGREHAQLLVDRLVPLVREFLSRPAAQAA
ncbi:aspartate aminotransferase family protein [Burkholderiaceae bacterium FT117]|uniref:aspartate aminotransferase family protein n=1 Tax=Zeimonas sediminis TaxID=2944268 RepID=UPI002342F384|nr:aspartate aminotransferase family protein [Zeimonas sediminis]MCM5572301.1 aspartate aminotransferase family protein [Zeimonas sediminis]